MKEMWSAVAFELWEHDHMDVHFVQVIISSKVDNI